MNKNFSFKNIITVLLIVIFIILIFIFNTESKEGAIRGLLLCGNVIIPSLFPFTVCVLMLLRSGFSNIFIKIKKPINKVFGINNAEFTALFLSFIGGYPIGAKMLNEIHLQGKTTKARAEIILPFCVNAGPAFIVLAVGDGILNSKTLGYILLTSHILASILLALASARNLKIDLKTDNSVRKQIPFNENFVSSVTDSAATILNICSFTILFSVISSILSKGNIKFFFYFTYLLEITMAVSSTKNLLFISFLLGFGGISVWLQVFCCCKGFNVNFKRFALFRVLHGVFSSILTFFLIKLFKINVYTISNQINPRATFVYSTPTLAISLLLMAIILVISLERKFHSRNLRDDLV